MLGITLMLASVLLLLLNFLYLMGVVRKLNKELDQSRLSGWEKDLTIIELRASELENFDFESNASFFKVDEYKPPLES